MIASVASASATWSVYLPFQRDRSTGSPKITSIGLRGKRLSRFDQRGSTRCAPQCAIGMTGMS